MQNGFEQLAHLRRVARYLDPGRLHHQQFFLGRSFAAGDDGTGAPHALARRRGDPGNEADHRFFHMILDPRGRNFLVGATDLADHDYRIRFRIVFEELQHVEMLEPVDRIAADAYRRRLSQVELGQLCNGLVGQCPRSRYHADAPFAMNVAGHDADLDLVRRDNAGAVRPEQQRLPALHAVTGANHVADRNALGDANHQIELRVDGFLDGARRKRRWYIDDAHRRAGGVLGFAYRHVNRNALEVLARLFRIDPGDEALLSVGIIAAHARMELAGLAGDSLRDDLGILVDQNAHSGSLHRRSRERGAGVVYARQ